MKSNKFMICAVFCISTAFSSELSVFDAGNLSSDEPYGLSDNEKIIFQSKKKVETLSRDYTGANSRISVLSDKVDGIQSVLDGINKSIYDNTVQIQQINEELDKNSERNITLENKVNSILYTTKLNTANIQKLQESVQELSGSIKELASLYNVDVSLKKTNSFDYDGKPLAEVLKLAIGDYEAKKYDNAKGKFLYLVDKNHRPAQCNFYLGQIAFETKDYNGALYHYKQSNSLYKKAKVNSSYMPTILLNSGLSLKNQGKNDEAEIFFKTLKESYPDSKEAKNIK